MAAIFSNEAFHRFAAVLKRTETLPRPELEAYQASLLKRLVTFAFKNSPFYTERLKPLFRAGEEPDLKCWRDIPILTRRDLATEIDRINPVNNASEVGAITARQTSGTTGAGLEFRTCDIARFAAEVMMHRLYRWHGLDLHSPLASIRYYSSGRRNYPEGITEPSWCLAHSAPHYTLDFRTPIPDMIEWLVRRQPKYLLTFPSIAHDIAMALNANGAPELGLQSIVGISELVSADTTIAVRKTLGCDILRIYACAEMGCIALQSEAEDEYEICEETVLVEIVDAQDRPVGLGENGRVVLTSLYNYATPFIRYEIGDFATLSGQQNASGRTLQKLQRVTGRRRNALVARDGGRRWDDAVITPSLCQQLPTHIFQIQQPAIEKIDVSFVSDGASSRSPQKDILADHFATLLGGPIDLNVIPIDQLPRGIGGKRERIISAVTAFD